MAAASTGFAQFGNQFNMLNSLTDKERMIYQMGAQDAQRQGGPQNCLPMLQEALSSSMSNSYNAYQNQTNTLMQNAEAVRKNAQSCRNNLLQQWQRYKEAEQANSRDRLQVNVKIRQAELEYKTELNKLKRQCQQQAVQEQTAFQEAVSKRGVINDPTLAVGFQQRINRFYDTAFNNCFRGDAVTREGIQLMKSSLVNKVMAINAEMEASDQALAYMAEQVQKLQEATIKDCDENEAITEYNAKQTEQVAQRGRAITVANNVLGTITAVASCGDPNEVQRQPTQANPDSTGSTRPAGTSF